MKLLKGMTKITIAEAPSSLKSLSLSFTILDLPTQLNPFSPSQMKTCTIQKALLLLAASQRQENQI